jgi:hypothetical protein
MPMQRWIASAAGGTSQRLKPAFATIRSRSSKPGAPSEAVLAAAIVSPKDYDYELCLRISGFFRFLARGGRHNQLFRTCIRLRLAAAMALRFAETAIIGLSGLSSRIASQISANLDAMWRRTN